MFPPMPDFIGATEHEEDTRTSVQTHGQSHSNSPSREMSVSTKTTSESHYIDWTIDKKSLSIARLAPKGERRGVIAAVIEKNGIEFKLELCASGWRTSSDRYSAFYLTIKHDDESFLGRYRVTVGDITKTSSIRHDFHLGVGFPNFCSHTTLDTLVTGNILRVQVTVEVFRSRSKVESHVPDFCSSERVNSLPILLEDIYLHRWHTDVVLVCQSHRIPAHKAFLSSASPVFQAMFSQPFSESSSTEVSLDRFSVQTVEGMIRFLYTAKLERKVANRPKQTATENLDDNENNSDLMNSGTTPCRSPSSNALMKESYDHYILNLFQFAEVYKMTSLVIACCQKMFSTVCVEKTCELLIRLDRHSHVPEIGEIQESMWEFVEENFSDIKNTSSFGKMVEQHPHIIAQLMDQWL